jgi:hypothetical protein
MTTQTRQPRRSLQPAIRRCSHPGLTDRAPSRSPAAVLGPAPQCRALRAPGWAGPPRTAPGDPPKHSSRPDRGFISSSPTPTLRRRARAAPRGTSPPTHRGRRGAAVNGGVAALGAGPGAQRAASLQPHYLDDRRHRPCVMGVPPSTTCRCCRSGPGVADESRFCLRAGGSRPWPPYVLSARRAANRLMSAQLGTSRACAGNARAGRKPRRSRTPRPRCSGRADVVRSSAVA